MSEAVRTPTLARPTSTDALQRNRYEVLTEIGAGGMACVEYARLHAAHGFVRNVAIKRLHPQFAKDPEFVKMFLDEARLCARLSHANIVATLDVIDRRDGLGLVMEYVHGESLSSLLELAQTRATPVPIHVATALIASVLHGLHAAHETRGDDGSALGIVHRDVSPHNILVGADGIVRVIDFGIAKAIGKSHATPNGEIKGKLIYMAPEQLDGGDVDRRADVYGAAAVLWETLCGLSLHDAATESALVHSVLCGTIESPAKHRSTLPPALDAIVMRGLERSRTARYDTARDMAIALERDVGIASQSELSSWLHELAGERLAARSRSIAQWHEQSAPPDSLLTAADLASNVEQSPTVLLPAGRPSATQASVLRRTWPFVAAVLVLLSAALTARFRRPAPALGPAAPAGQEAFVRPLTAATGEPPHSEPTDLVVRKQSADSEQPQPTSRPEAAPPHVTSLEARPPSPLLSGDAAGSAPADARVRRDDIRRHSPLLPGDAAVPAPAGARAKRDDIPPPSPLSAGAVVRSAHGASVDAPPPRAASPASTATAAHHATDRPARAQVAPARAAESAANTTDSTQSPAAPAGSAANGCKPWFYIDEAGIRRPKPGCL